MCKEKALTMGVLAKRAGCELHQAQYIVSSKGIEAIQRAGNLRIFPDEAVQILKDALEQRKAVANVG